MKDILGDTRCRALGHETRQPSHSGSGEHLTYDQHLAELFGLIRRSRTLTRSEVAAAAKCAPRTVDRLEDGKMPCTRIQYKISESLDMPLWKIHRLAYKRVKLRRASNLAR